MRPNESDLKNQDDREMIVVITTLADIEKAKLLAYQIVDQRLAACCNIVPTITSIYRWQGELCDQQECLLVMKTLKNRYIALDRLVRSTHPYEVPELLALPVTNCFDEYLSWVIEETA